MAAEGVEVDQCGGPGGLQLTFAGADVATLAGFVAVGEQTEEPLDPRTGAAQMVDRGRVFERSTSSGEKLFARVEPQWLNVLRGPRHDSRSAQGPQTSLLNSARRRPERSVPIAAT